MAYRQVLQGESALASKDILCYDSIKRKVREMSRIIIACSTLKNELLEAMARCCCTDSVLWLPAGAHNNAAKRANQIQSALGKCKDCDTVLLCMTFCGDSLMGIHSAGHTLVFPQFADCISLLVGADSRDMESYYLSEGWLSGKENILNEYEAALQKYGNARADGIFSAMFRNYKNLVWIGSSPAPDRVRIFAERFGLTLRMQTPDLSVLENMIRGVHDMNLRIIPPDTTITREMRK